MKLLPFMDIPVVEGKAPSPIERFIQIVEWSSGDKVKLSAGFLAVKGTGEEVENYLFQIAYILDNCLVTNKEVIQEVGKECIEYKEWKKATKLKLEIRRHLELYFSKVNLIPPWGISKYWDLLVEGYTPRILYGPHKGAGLKPNQKRQVILDASNEMVFGPLL